MLRQDLRFRWILLICLLSAWLACHEDLKLTEPDWEKETDVVTVDDLNIVRAVLDQTFQGKEERQCKYVVLLNRTERLCSYANRPWENFCISDNSREGTDEILSRVAKLRPELREAFRVRNRRFGIIKGIAPAAGVKLVNRKELETLSEVNFWAEFYKRFPNACGFVSFSLPGYSADRLAAAVYLGAACGGTCGSSQIYELGFLNGHWSVMNNYVLSLS